MSGINIGESQVRRLAHEVGAELIGERDRKVVEHRRQVVGERRAHPLVVDEAEGAVRVAA
jgi:hypothetical protein